MSVTSYVVSKFHGAIRETTVLTVIRHLLELSVIHSNKVSFMSMSLYGENQPQKNWSAAGVV